MGNCSPKKGRRHQIEISEIRKKAGLTQKSLAEKMHVTKKTINNWESGRVKIPFAQLNLLCQICGTDFEEIK